MENIGTKAKQLADYIQSLNDFEIIEYTMGGYNNMGATIIEGILQANINYRSVVKPRVEKFIRQHPKCKDLKSFQALINKKNIENIIEFRGEKCRRIVSLTEFLLKNGINIEKQFKKWLGYPNNLTKLNKLKGIGNKTIDYFKILVGISTVAIDRHIVKFLKMAGIPFKNYSEAHQITTGAAKLLNVNPSFLDHSIWRYMSSRPRKNKLRESEIEKKFFKSRLLCVYQLKNGQMAIRPTDSRHKIISHKIFGEILPPSINDKKLGRKIRENFKKCGGHQNLGRS